MRYVVNGSSSSLVSTASAKSHLRVLHSNDDTYIGTLLTAASAAAEAYTKRTFIRKDVTLHMNAFPGDEVITIEDYNPVRSITSIVYLDADGTSAALTTSDYNYEIDRDGVCRIYPAYSTSWPAEYAYEDSETNVRVRFKAGPTTVSGSTDPPQQAIHAIKMIVADWYYNRENASVGTVTAALKMPFAAEALLDQVATPRF